MRFLTAVTALSLLGTGAPALAGGGCSSGSNSASNHHAEMTTTTVAYSASKDIVDTAVGAGSFKTLAAALQAADLVGALKGDGPFTVFAPSDDAFAKLPAGTVEKLLRPENKALLQSVLMYHVVEGKVMADKVVGLNKATTLTGQTVDITVQGGKVKIDDANVIKTDIACSNGVIHVIDTVIMPETANLVETALSAGQFGTLAAALEAANLVNALSAEGPFTVFAPTDAAFDKLPRGTVESLLKPENRDRLKAVLTYHVVPGRISSSEALSAQSAKTLQGGLVRITMKDGSLYVNDARVIANDIETSNGVIHVIDTVILPG